MRLVPLPQMAVEFGVNEGRTAKLVLREFPSLRHYVGIDVEPDYVPALPVQRQERPERPGHLAASDARFELMITRRGSLDLSPADIGPTDIAFIDGDHSAAVVAHDAELARAIVQPGGIIIFHDYNEFVDVRAILDRDFEQGRDIRHVENTWLAFERG